MTTGIVICSPKGGNDILGIPVAIRAVLALQTAGCELVLLVGEGANDVWGLTRGDKRVTAIVEAVQDWRGGEPAVVVGSDVLVDVKAARELCKLSDNRVVRAYDNVILAGHTIGPVTTEEQLAQFVPAKIEGVAMMAETPIEARAAETALLESLRKPQDGWVSKRINRPISLSISRILARTGVKPNPLSVVILFIGLLGSLMATRGDHAALLFGALLFQMQSILDGCDGELSRLKFLGSKAGEWLDSVGDDLTNYSFFLAAAYGISKHEGAWGWVWPVGAFGVFVGMVASAIEYRYLYTIGSGDLTKYPLGFGNDPEPVAAETPITKLLGMARPAFKRDFFVFLTLIAALLGPRFMSLMIAVFAGGAAATLVAVIKSEMRMAEERKNAPPPPPPEPPKPVRPPPPPPDMSVPLE